MAGEIEKKRKLGHGLTDRQKMFCREYLKDFNMTQAALRAGYAKKNSKVAGSELLSNPYVLQELQKVIRARVDKAEISADAVLQELKTLGYQQITDYLDVKNGKVCIRDTEDIDPAKIGAISAIKQNADGSIEIKLHDKIKALELLGRYLKLFVDITESHNLHWHAGSLQLDISALYGRDVQELRGEVEKLREELAKAEAAALGAAKDAEDETLI